MHCSCLMNSAKNVGHKKDMNSAKSVGHKKKKMQNVDIDVESNRSLDLFLSYFLNQQIQQKNFFFH